MLTLQHVSNDIKNKKPNKKSDKSHPAFYKTQNANMRKKIEPCLKWYGLAITERHQQFHFS
jgi:hypothetical protein